MNNKLTLIYIYCIALLLLLVSNCLSQDSYDPDYIIQDVHHEPTIDLDTNIGIYKDDDLFKGSIHSIIPQEVINAVLQEYTQQYIKLEGIENNFLFNNVTFDLNDGILHISSYWVYKLLKKRIFMD